jgi:hypothetical protein
VQARSRIARLLFQLPRESRVFSAVKPSTQWGWNEILSNKIAYLLEVIIWQNSTPNKPGERAQHNANKPTLFVPPFMSNKDTDEASNKGTVAASTDDIQSLLSMPRS